MLKVMWLGSSFSSHVHLDFHCNSVGVGKMGGRYQKTGLKMGRLSVEAGINYCSGFIIGDLSLSRSGLGVAIPCWLLLFVNFSDKKSWDWYVWNFLC